ncbi:hypothetical protein ALI144C_13785 [Actinosynnema sp. ALI-1.44]|nr:hypothetical protein ALI144C_13785 [Actinosynnema sp. ALI-1.44]
MRIAPDGTTVLTSRNGLDFTDEFLMLTGVLPDALDGRAAVLDGEIVVYNEHGQVDNLILCLLGRRASDPTEGSGPMTKPAVLLVGGDGYADVGSALRFARSGDVIEIAPGTYDGEVVIDKAVEVRPSEGAGTVTLTAATGNTLMVLADAAIHDLSLVGSGWDWAAIEVAGRNVYPSISNCDIRAPHSVGIRVRGGADPLVADCRIGPAAHGLRVEAAAGFYERCAFFDVALESVIAMAGATPTVLNSAFTGPGRQAAVATDRDTVLTLSECEIAGGSVTATGNGSVTITDSVIHGGGPALEITDDGVLHAHKVRIIGTAPEGILISGGDGVFTECRITGTQGPAVWMTAGKARFEHCEAIDSDRAGFLVVGGAAEFLECVAHNNADQGFSFYTAVELTRCSSYGNGRPDGVGVASPDPLAVPERNTPRPPALRAKPPAPQPRPPVPKAKPSSTRRQDTVRRVGTDGYPTISAAIDAARAGDTIEIEPGTYTEDSITVEKPLTICAAGEPGSVHLRHSPGIPLQLTANATVRGIAVSNEASRAKIARIDGDGVEAVFDQCTFSGSGSLGVLVMDGARATFTRCDVHGSGVEVMEDRSTADLRDCTITNATDAALTVHSGSRMELTNVLVRGGNKGLMLSGGTVAATGLTIADTRAEGIQVHGGTGVFTDCETVGAMANGVWIADGTAEFEHCTAIGSRQSGFSVSGGTATFTRCTAKDNRSMGFKTLDKATFVACRSLDNGDEDEIGVQPDGPGPHVLRARTYAELKQTLRNASPGDTIELEPGRYRCVDRVRIPAGVEVRPAESTGTVRLVAKYHPIVISGSATLRNILIYAEYQTAVTITGVGNSTLLDGCQITATDGIAVKVAKGATPTLRDCKIGPAKQGLVVRGAGGHCERCTFTATPEPVTVSDSVGLRFSDCVVRAVKGKQVAVTRKNPPLALTGDRLAGTVETGRHATVRADREPSSARPRPPASTKAMITGLRTSLAEVKARLGLQRQLGLVDPHRFDLANDMITTLEQEIQELEDLADGREFPTLPEHEKQVGREINRRIDDHAARLNELLD